MAPEGLKRVRLSRAAPRPYTRASSTSPLDPKALMSEGVIQPTVPTASSGLQAALDFLAQLTQVVASTNELQPILDWMVEKISAMLGADEGSIRLLGPEMMAAAPHTIVRKPRAGLESGS